MSKKGIIFDLDGTLWDAAESNTETWNKVLAQQEDIEKQITVDELKSYMGKTLQDIAVLVLPDMKPEDSFAILQKCCAEENRVLREKGGILFDGLEDVLDELKKDYHLYVVSNCLDGYVQAFLEYHQLGDVFEDIEMAGRTGLGKADNIKIVVERNNLDEAVYVGDTDGDCKATMEAGLPFIYAEYGFGNVENPEYEITDIKELPEVIKKVNWTHK